jgi:hypothetical protein
MQILNESAHSPSSIKMKGGIGDIKEALLVARLSDAFG